MSLGSRAPLPSCAACRRDQLHDGADITDPAIVAAAELSHRDITYLVPAGQGHHPRPGAAHQDGNRLQPESMDKLDRRIIQLKIERGSGEKEKDRRFLQRG